MGDSGTRFPVERRRAKASEAAADVYQYPPHARRESDLVRSKIQHWMELADAALDAEKAKKGRRTAR